MEEGDTFEINDEICIYMGIRQYGNLVDDYIELYFDSAKIPNRKIVPNNIFYNSFVEVYYIVLNNNGAVVCFKTEANVKNPDFVVDLISFVNQKFHRDGIS